MKKVFIIILMLICFYAKPDSTNVNADQYSTDMSFNVPYDNYGDALDVSTKAYDVYYQYNSNPYYVGEVETKLVTYEYEHDSDYTLVIYKTSVLPDDVRIKVGFWNYRTYTGRTDEITPESDVNSGTYYVYYPYVYYSPAGFEMISYAPYYEIPNEDYDMQVGDLRVEAERSPDVDIIHDYNTASGIYKVTFQYDHGQYSSDIDEEFSEQRGMYLIKTSGTYVGTTGSFVNSLETTFRIIDDKSYFADTIKVFTTWVMY